MQDNRTTNGRVNGMAAYYKHKTEEYDRNFDKIDWTTKVDKCQEDKDANIK